MNNAHSAPKSILITGASSGIGEALALHYASPGIFLALTGRNEERLTGVAQACRSKGAEVETAALCVTETAKMENWIQSLDDRHYFNLVIANAGISGGTGGPMIGESVSQARAIFNVNLNGVLNTIDPILPRMIARKSGQIALISSMAGFRGFPGAPAYCASKGAVRFYGEALRGAVRASGVKINVVCPGFVKSRMTDVNGFPMPFLWTAEKAARRIADGLARDTGRIAFPWPIHLTVWFLSLLPDFIVQKLLIRLPAKSSSL